MKRDSQPREAAMANEEHLKILKQGVDAWNAWRGERPEITPDISRVNLNEAALPGANLGEALLVGARFFGANLVGANLRCAHLQTAFLLGARLSRANLCQARLDTADLGQANLDEADLSGASLSRTELSGANLRRANLSKAILMRANLFGADLARADLSGAQLYGTVFGANDLGTVRGLESAQHLGPSTIGIDTIFRSKGNIPESFLRGAGVPEDFIVYMKSLVVKAIEFYSCFISYSSKDQEFAERLRNDLQGKGVRCWFAAEDLKIGDRFQERIEESIRVYDKVIVVLSANSVDSRWVEREVQAAFEKEGRQPDRTVLFPISLDDTVTETPKAWTADIRRTRHIGNFRNWKDHDAYSRAFNRLLEALNRPEK